jgi:hypothetical protein
MQLQIIKDGYGNNTGVFVPMNDWDTITQKHQDLKELIATETKPKKIKLSELVGSLSKETAEDMQKYVTDSRNEWEDRLNKQF